MNEELQKAQRLLSEQKYKEAESIANKALLEDGENVDAMYILGVSFRLQNLNKKAVRQLKKVVEKKTDFGRGYQELAYAYLGLEEYQLAGNAFEHAVHFDTSLVNSWKYLSQLYGQAGQTEKANKAEERAKFLGELPIELLGVISYLSDRKLTDAERLCRHFLNTNKTHVEGMRLLAEIMTLNKTFDDAEFLLESCVEFEPENRNARLQYTSILMKTQKFHKAYEQSKILLEKFPQEEAIIGPIHASTSMGIGENNEAIEYFDEAIKHNPDNPYYLISQANIYKTIGDIDKAVSLYQKAYTINPGHGDSYWSLANTKSYKFTEKEILLMHEQEQEKGISDLDRAQVCFALAKSYEDNKEYEKSFQYYDKGNEIKRKSSSHNERQFQSRIDSQIEICTKAFFEEKSGNGYENPDPIFILGLPRAGSTLLEQILSSHSLVDGTMELHNILNLAKRLRGRVDNPDGTPKYPSMLTDLDLSYYRRFGEQFINDTRVYRQNAPYFIDKMPNNFFHIGLIKLILPNAKIIDARRHPMSCCFSGFKQLFGEGQEFTYGLTEIGNYYKQYVKLMDHWDEVLPGFVLRVQHEDVINDLEGQVRRMLDFCGLEFEEACVNYHQTERSIRTPSAEQVRQPIFRTSMEQWRNFETWLNPLKEALGEEILRRYPT